MTGRLRNGLIAAAVVTFAIGAGTPAAALSFDDISGKWCGRSSSYQFTPGKLIVFLYSDGSRREYKVDSYKYEDDAITVNWQRDNEKLFTKFAEFSADRQSMAQQQNDAGPRREFKKCS